MFERYLASTLQSFLGEYFEEGSFSREKLSVGAWDGSVVLTDLRLKKHALDVLNLPLEIKVGTIGRLKLEIPWSRLGTKPLTVVAERVLLLAVPKASWTVDETTAQQDTVKRARLSLAELSEGELDLSDDSEGGVGGSGGAGGGGAANPAERLSAVAQTLLQRLLDRFVDSIQVHVASVHLRYEDVGGVSLPGAPFCVGATLDSLHAMSAAPQAAPPRGGLAAALAASMGPPPPLAPWLLNDEGDGSDDDEGDCDESEARPISKLLQLNKLSVYWEPLRAARAGSAESSDDEKEEEEHEEEEKEAGRGGSAALARLPADAAVAALEALIPRATKPAATAWSHRKEEGAATTGAADALRRFVVSPLDVEVRVTIARGSSSSSSSGCGGEDSRPFVEVDAAVGALDLMWCDAQHAELLALLVAFGSQGQSDKHAAHRPRASPLQAPAAWWRYAGRVVTHEVVRAHDCYSWPFLANRRQQRLEYVALWKRKRVGKAPGGGGNSDDDEFSDDESDDDDGGGGAFGSGGRPGRGRRSRVRDAYACLNASEVARLKALEGALAFDDVVVFRAMGDRQLLTEVRAERHARRVAEAAAAAVGQTPPGHARRGLPSANAAALRPRTWLGWLTGGGSEAGDDDQGDDGSEGRCAMGGALLRGLTADDRALLWHAADWDPAAAAAAAERAALLADAREDQAAAQKLAAKNRKVLALVALSMARGSFVVASTAGAEADAALPLVREGSHVNPRLSRP
jgi:hypothetical protein